MKPLQVFVVDFVVVVFIVVVIIVVCFFFKETSGTVKKISRENYIIAAFILFYF